MSDLNVSIVEGRLTKSAELKHLNNANRTAVCTFCIANNRSHKGDNGEWIDDVSYFDCELWGKYGETMASKLVKGEKVTIVGRLDQDRWEKNGQYSSRVKITVEQLHMVPRKTSTGTNNAPAPSYEPAPEQVSYPSPEAAENDYPEDIPF